MVVDDLHVPRIFVLSAEANPPLVINTDAVLALAVPLQGFKAVAAGHSQVIQAPCLMHEQQLPPCCSLNLLGRPPRWLVTEQSLRFAASEAAYHLWNL